MPEQDDIDWEAFFLAIRDYLKEQEDRVNGPGAFDQMVKKGEIMMTKRPEELTPEERAFLEAPPPAKQC